MPLVPQTQLVVEDGVVLGAIQAEVHPTPTLYAAGLLGTQEEMTPRLYFVAQAFLPGPKMPLRDGLRTLDDAVAWIKQAHLPS